MGFGIPSSCLKFFIKTCFELETDAIVVKVRGGASEGDVHGLDGSSPVFNHEIGEGKHCEAFPVN